MLLILGASPAFAIVDLTLFNTFALLDSDGSTPLAGISTGGDLAQLILVGPNGVIDPPDLFGNPGGDDSLLFTTHVGAGLTSTNTGLLVQSGILYANSLIGTGAFVRFWNSNTAANSTFYGTSMVFALPAGDAFGLAELDFVPLAGSPRTANIPFSAQAAAIPEPSQLFLLGLMIIGGWLYRKRRKQSGTFFALAGLLALAQTATAQISLPLDVTASAVVRNSDGAILPGNNPAAPSPIPGCLVQVLWVGANGVPDLPDPSKPDLAGGDDTVIFTTVIGQGMDPAVQRPGRFSTSFYPPPTAGSKLFARVFNAPTIAAADSYGQSATFTVSGAEVMDISTLGLTLTTQPKDTNPTVTDTDGDGQTDYAELVANTNARDASDRFDVGGILMTTGPAQTIQLNVAGRAGRRYTLQRSTDELTGPMTWVEITTTGVLTEDTNVVLSDPSPPSSQKAFYRLKVTMP